MKLLFAAFIILLSGTAFGQGQVYFDNLAVGAPISYADGVSGPGAAGRAQLALVNGMTTTAVGPVQGFLTSSSEHTKYISPTVVTLDGIAAGEMATFVVRVWLHSDTFEAAVFRGESPEITVTLGGGVTVPPNLEGLEPMTIVPEPSIASIALAGVAAILFCRRKRSEGPVAPHADL